MINTQEFHRFENSFEPHEVTKYIQGDKIVFQSVKINKRDLVEIYIYNCRWVLDNQQNVVAYLTSPVKYAWFGKYVKLYIYSIGLKKKLYIKFVSISFVPENQY